MKLTEQQKLDNIEVYRYAMENGIENIQASDDNGKSWYKKITTNFYINQVYRLKLPPSLRPWLPEEAIGKYVKDKNGSTLYQVISAGYTSFVIADGPFIKEISRQRFLDLYTQIDGSPCGMLENKE